MRLKDGRLEAIGVGRNSHRSSAQPRATCEATKTDTYQAISGFPPKFRVLPPPEVNVAHMGELVGFGYAACGEIEGGASSRRQRLGLRLDSNEYPLDVLVLSTGDVASDYWSGQYSGHAEYSAGRSELSDTGG